MRQLFDPHLVNDAFGDPGLHVDFHDERRAVLFDLGDLAELPPRKLIRLTHVFVTHTHMDHFAGFDQLLRVVLGRKERLALFGGPGFIASDLPKGTQEGLNDWGRTGYGGPCPPIGRHRYFHKLYALDVMLPNLGRAKKAALEKAMEGHILAQAVLVGTYRKHG